MHQMMVKLHKDDDSSYRKLSSSKFVSKSDEASVASIAAYFRKILVSPAKPSALPMINIVRQPEILSVLLKRLFQNRKRSSLLRIKQAALATGLQDSSLASLSFNILSKQAFILKYQALRKLRTRTETIASIRKAQNDSQRTKNSPSSKQNRPQTNKENDPYTSKPSPSHRQDPRQPTIRSHPVHSTQKASPRPPSPVKTLIFPQDNEQRCGQSEDKWTEGRGEGVRGCEKW